MNPVEIEEAVSELSAEPFDRAEFPFQFLAAFGNKKTTIKRLRKGNSNQSDVRGVLQRNNIHILACDDGTTGEALKALRDSPKTTSQKAKFILATDGSRVEAEDLVSGETVACAFEDLPDRLDLAPSRSSDPVRLTACIRQPCDCRQPSRSIGNSWAQIGQ